ncbi:MAG: hypothetical protein Q8R53_01355 [Nanoarchaeota archaeon]|nr:hypothetical protein [Nanoarchaeota archaeon]
MVVGPKELARWIEESEKEKIKENELLISLENEIDQCLEENYQSGMAIIPESTFDGVRSALVTTVLNRYRSAGWSVEREYEQGDVTYYTFIPSPQNEG